MKKQITLYLTTLLLSLTGFAQKFESDLSMYFPFDGDTEDHSGNGFSSTANSISDAPDRFGYKNQSANFAGSPSVVSIPHDDSHTDLNEAFTISMWVNVADFSARRVMISKLNGGTRELVYRFETDGRPSMHFESTGLKFCTSDSVVTAGEWTHVALVWDGAFVHHYRNGLLMQSCDHEGSAFGLNAGTWRIGSLTGTSENFSGEIDELRVYGKAMNEDMIWELYKYDGLKEGLILDFPFDGSGEDNGRFGNHATVEGTTAAMDRFGRGSGAIYFDGIDDVLSLEDDTSYRIQYPMSFSTWIWMEDSSMQSRVFTNCNHPSLYKGIVFGTQEGVATASFMDGRGYGSQYRRSALGDIVMTSKQWHHVVAVIEGPTDFTLYTDGVKNTPNLSGTGTSTIAYDENLGTIGAWDKNPNTEDGFSNIALDDLKMWDRALTMDEVQCLSEAGTTNDLGMVTGVFNQLEDSELTIFPNPVSSHINLTHNQDILSVEILDLVGNTVLITESTKSIDVSHLNNGSYILRAELLDGQYTSQKFVVVE
jgi:hypothetical protein